MDCMTDIDVGDLHFSDGLFEDSCHNVSCACGVLTIVERVREYFKGDDWVNFEPDRDFYYTLKKAWRIHKSVCEIHLLRKYDRRVHSATGKCSAFAIIGSLIHRHKNDIEDAAQLIQNVLLLFKKRTEYYEQKKPSAFRTRCLQKLSRDVEVLQYNLKR